MIYSLLTLIYKSNIKWTNSSIKLNSNMHNLVSCSLCDFLGNTSEIVILNFLMGNPESSYTIAEISGLTGLSRTTVYAKVPEMMANGLIEIDGEIRQVKTFKITDNAILKNLFNSVFAHSFREADQPMGIDEAIRIMKRRVGPLALDTNNRNISRASREQASDCRQRC